MANIMIVDDSPIILQRLRIILEELGHCVVAEAADGQEAVDQYGKHDVDLVTMDIQMPGMDGIEAVRLIREKDPSAAIVMVSSVEDRNKVFEAIKRGAKHYILKPFNGAKVYEVVNAVLGAPAKPPMQPAAPAVERASASIGAAGSAPAKPKEVYELQPPDIAALPFELLHMEDRMILMVQRHINHHHLRVLRDCLQGLLYFRKIRCVLECWEPIRDEEGLRLLLDFIGAARSRKGATAIVTDDSAFYTVLQSKLKTGVYRSAKEIPW